MTAASFASLDIVPHWGRMNDTIIQLVDYLPDDKMNWSPRPGLWNVRGIFLHICIARQNWLGSVIKDGQASPDILREGQTRDGMKKHLRSSWERVSRLLSDPAKLAATYDDNGVEVTGHWIAYHLLEHDIHHRADIFHYLALLGIEHPEIGTP